MKNLFISLSIISSLVLSANPGDTTHVISHNHVLVVTDPSQGNHGYKAWATFPASTLPVRKVIATLSYKRPATMACGAWDYLDYLYLRRQGGVNQLPKDVEMVRFITPYGNTFTSTWKFSWHLDITDYASLLKDSCEIEYIHGGYEGTNVGWDVTVDFAIIEGTPIADPISFTQLKNGSFGYGNAGNSIENALTPDTIMIDPLCAFTKLSLLHSGHGSDANNCSEFCPKYRKVIIDGNTINQRSRWRTCGNNALYPQGGTWLYDRANWCPGSIVQPDITMSTNLTPGIKHIFNVDMESYTANGGAYEVIDEQLFQYKQPNNALDATIYELIQPSKISEYARLNPICTNPVVMVKNNGSTAISNLDIKYGLKGSTMQTYNWTGNLNFADTATITLPNFVMTATTPTNSVFQAYIDGINSQPDQYHYDDTASTKITLPPVYDTAFIIYLTTNNVLEDSWYLQDDAGNVLYSRVAANLTPGTVYKDTVNLPRGCYNLSIYDSGGDGLSFFANSSQGSGSFLLKKFNTAYNVFYKAFTSDFGNFTKFEFFASPGAFGVGVEDHTSPKSSLNMMVFPNPTAGKAMIDYTCPENSKPTISVFDALGRTVRHVELVKSTDFYPLDLSDLNKGFYWIKLQSEGQNIIQKIIKD